MAGGLLSIGSFSLMFIAIRLDDWSIRHHWHQAFAVLCLAGLLGAGALWLADNRYMRRLRQVATEQSSS